MRNHRLSWFAVAYLIVTALLVVLRAPTPPQLTPARQVALQPPAPLYGATIYPDMVLNGHTYRGSAWSHPEFAATLDQDILTAQAAHLTTIRATDYLSHASSPYSAVVWANMDHLLHLAATHGMRVILTLDALRGWLKQQGRTDVYSLNDWLPFVRFVGARYALSPDASAFAYLGIAGEIPPPTGHDPTRLTAAGYVAFYTAVSNALWATAPDLPQGSGGLSFLNKASYGIPWPAIYGLPHIAHVEIHVYSQGDETISIPEVASWAAAHGKPWGVEEFGFQQGVGDATRAADYQRVIGAAKAHNASLVAFWNLGPEMKASSYDVSMLTPLTWAVVQAEL